MRRFAIAAAFCLMSFGLISTASAARFTYPTWNGYAMDWCKYFERDCGQPAADLYCQKRGYPRSNGFQIRPNVNVLTMTIGNNAVCSPAVHRCDSFNYIDCQQTTVTFWNPTWHGYRLDWCRVFENECGQPAARQWCQKMGYADAVNFQQLGRVNVQTMTVGSNAICNPAFHSCDSFRYVQCRR